MSELITTTSRLVIRKIEDGDQDLVYNISREIPALESFQEDCEFLKLYREVCWNETNSPNIYNGMIFLKDSGIFVGKICMQNIDHAVPELGIDIMKAHQNCGYGPEAIIAFCNWYSATYKIYEIKVRIREENTHSIHVFEKLGAKCDKATSYFSKDVQDVIKRQLPDADLSVLSQNSVKDYLLQLPFYIS